MYYGEYMMEDKNKKNPKPKRKWIKWIIFLSVVLLIFSLVFYEFYLPKILYRPITDYELTYYKYWAITERKYMRSGINTEICDTSLVTHKIKGIDHKKMVSAKYSSLYYDGRFKIGTVAYICKAKDLNIEPIHDFEFEKITVNDIEITNKKFLTAVKVDILAEKIYVTSLDGYSTEFYGFITLHPGSVGLDFSVIKKEGEIYYKINTNQLIVPLPMSVVSETVYKYLCDNFGND